MSYDLSDRIDDYSRDMHGHSNWAYVDTLSKEDKAKIKEGTHPEGILEGGILFYYNPSDENE
jgi:hypothetical protein